MKKKILFGILGSGLIIGTVAYKLIIKGKKNIYNDSDKEVIQDNSDVILSENNIENIEQEEINLCDIKTQSGNSIYNRHKEASEIIKESIENINRNSEVISNHKDEFDGMLDDLDGLSEKR